jgi:uncharacterized membrane protein YfbV (UPF0208 family)
VDAEWQCGHFGGKIMVRVAVVVELWTMADVAVAVAVAVILAVIAWHGEWQWLGGSGTSVFRMAVRSFGYQVRGQGGSGCGVMDSDSG